MRAIKPLTPEEIIHRWAQVIYDAQTVTGTPPMEIADIGEMITKEKEILLKAISKDTHTK